MSFRKFTPHYRRTAASQQVLLPNKLIIHMTSPTLASFRLDDEHHVESPRAIDLDTPSFGELCGVKEPLVSAKHSRSRVRNKEEHLEGTE